MSKSKSDRDNHANQLNPNNDAWWQSRGEQGRPTEPSPAPATEAPPATPSEKGGTSK